MKLIIAAILIISLSFGFEACCHKIEKESSKVSDSTQVFDSVRVSVIKHIWELEAKTKIDTVANEKPVAFIPYVASIDTVITEEDGRTKTRVKAKFDTRTKILNIESEQKTPDTNKTEIKNRIKDHFVEANKMTETKNDSIFNEIANKVCWFIATAIIGLLIFLVIKLIKKA